MFRSAVELQEKTIIIHGNIILFLKPAKVSFKMADIIAENIFVQMCSVWYSGVVAVDTVKRFSLSPYILLALVHVIK